jgi:hypothetical protein
MDAPLHGLWIDDAPRRVMTPEYLDDFRRHGFRVGAVMLETVTPGFDPKWTPRDLARLGETFRKADLELVVTVWPEPRLQYIEELAKKLPTFLEASGAAALEFDAESNFTRKKVVGFKNLDDASGALVAVVSGFKTMFDVRTEITTFTMHEENSPRAKLADDCDRTVNQGYSVRNRTDGQGVAFEVPWNHQFGPGSMQRLTFDRAASVPKKNGKPTLSCGLAAYDQRWPNRSIAEAMQTAYDACLPYQPKEIRWWSSKWVIGGQAQTPQRMWFAELARRLAA